MKKYTVTLEFKVRSIDLLDIDVEAANKKEAILKAQEYYIENPDESELHSSDYYSVHLDIGNMDVTVEEREWKHIKYLMDTGSWSYETANGIRRKDPEPPSLKHMLSVIRKSI